MEDGDESALGRLSEANRGLLKAELLEVQKRAQAVALKTGLSTSQVFNHWMSATWRKHTKQNVWNLYRRYFKAHEEQELARLGKRKFVMSSIDLFHTLIPWAPSGFL